ncbi:MAG: glycosyltransferase [Armatimonadota bacterium]|nr:glycosyltransferase [Armatimonadota bacterium]
MPAAGVREERLSGGPPSSCPAGEARRPAVVFLTSAFPVRADGGADAVLARRARALAELTQVAVVVPTPWAPRWLGGLVRRWRTYAETPRRLEVMGVEAFYPRYVQIPARWFVPFAPLAMAAGSLRRLRSLRRAGRLDVIYAQAVLPDGLAGALVGKCLGVPSVCLARGTDVNVMGRRTRIGRRLTRVTVRWSAGVVAVAHDLARTLQGIVGSPSLPPVIANGIDLELFHPGDRRMARRALDLSPDGHLLLFVGRLVPGKGLTELLDVFPAVLGRHPSAALALVGDGPLAPTLRRQAKALGIEGRVVFAGERPHREIASWMQAASVFVLPSESEGFPNVVREALASGCPVVATTVGDLPRVVTPSEGRLVSVGDRRALSEALLDVLASRWDPRHLRNAVLKASWERNADETLAVLRDFVGR